MEYLQLYRRSTESNPQPEPMTRELTFPPPPWIRGELVWTCLAAGEVYARHGDVREAERHWLRAAALDPANIASRKVLAALYRKLGNIREWQRMNGQIREIESNSRQAGER